MHFSHRQGRFVEPEAYGMPGFPRAMLDVVTFEALPGGSTLLTLRRDHSEALAHRFGEDEGWRQSFDRFAEVLAAPEVGA